MLMNVMPLYNLYTQTPWYALERKIERAQLQSILVT